MSKFFIRLLALPFWIAIVAIHHVVMIVKLAVNFLRFGGETITYTMNNRSKTIAEVYEKQQHLLAYLTTPYSEDPEEAEAEAAARRVEQRKKEKEVSRGA